MNGQQWTAQPAFQASMYFSASHFNTALLTPFHLCEVWHTFCLFLQRIWYLPSVPPPLHSPGTGETLQHKTQDRTWFRQIYFYFYKLHVILTPLVRCILLLIQKSDCSLYHRVSLIIKQTETKKKANTHQKQKPTNSKNQIHMYLVRKIRKDELCNGVLSITHSLSRDPVHLPQAWLVHNHPEGHQHVHWYAALSGSLEHQGTQLNL